MTDRELLKMALEALEGIHVGNMTPMAEENWNKALTALRQALAQGEQTCCCGEPDSIGVVHCKDVPCYVAQGEQEPVDIHCPSCLHSFSIVPVAKREWVGLTDEERRHYNNRLSGSGVAEEIEAKLKERQL
ncbi:hypothetical protein UFOVP686_5 [uncultured Caudovirales phage]|uniref:Uncharacterized protein n=1 Tax=uncultured Caudovirales phage TaxID=2100421 RepID=A0A6J5NIF9_9CAUD|nr:hypothetical protein UFOVP686_5 [uncultured Caudovirales phage]CAB5225420.1 hypothetical protein UFOVP752_15 [uncultured Caudovirales phage]